MASVHNAAVALEPRISARLKRNADGLVCAVVQQHDSREVLMVGWMDANVAAYHERTGGTRNSASTGDLNR